ncbi:phosphoglycerate mutase-like protein [Polychaeton citri CBS 116435]|uniref:Phosphoglycerate mutase-like protein n=1 Tax=Polychaeton citri CBS 116435 TaxID=1314669 RepID=A0A9P4UNB0_9PEZI|nr:phosphoglycerate mutase-like protein [Polychaeton citri CBS 116435]
MLSITGAALLSGLMSLSEAQWQHHGPPNGPSHGRPGPQILKDIDTISLYWGQVSPYRDNSPDAFGIDYTGLPDGCQIEQAHTLQRHSQRFPTGYFDDGTNDERLAEKVSNFTSANPGAKFSGPLAFLNSYRYNLGASYLTGLGASTEFMSGVQFWNRYGRILYNASEEQLYYEPQYANGTARVKPVLRTTGQSRIENSQISWSLGFFGPSFQEVPDPTLAAFGNGSWFDVVIIPEGGTENNTLAAYDSCFADFVEGIGDIGDIDAFYVYKDIYLQDATKRLQRYVPDGFNLTTNDTYAMQSLCAYETGYTSASSFCTLFTLDEWAGFESSLDIAYYYDYGYGNPTGRAQGVGYVQELLARLTNQYITSSNSSVNSTLTDNPDTFPLGRPFYADFSHDDIIISALAAMSVDYFKDPPSLSDYPPDPSRKFNLRKLTPFGARMITEVIGCADPNPAPVEEDRVYYYPEQYGYDASNAPYKFVRMRLNHGIVPLDSIRGGYCKGRADGLCALEDFLESQWEAEKLANYDFSCFANYTVVDVESGRDFDGTVNTTSHGIVVYPGNLTADDF